MEPLNITQVEGGFHVQGYPNATKIIEVSGPKAKQLSDVALHKIDLEFARECLDSMNEAPDHSDAFRQSLWRSAITHYIKCFGHNKSRSSLSYNKIYSNEPKAKGPFEYFKDLRNKHLIHDENSYAQCIPGAILNKADSSVKIARIVTLSVLSESLCQQNYANLYNLIDRALKWVTNKYDSLCNSIAKELEDLPFSELNSRDQIRYRVPELKDLKVPRNAL